MRRSCWLPGRLTGTGGLAATGSLPDAAQELAHDLGQHVGPPPDAPGQAKLAGDHDAHEHAPGIKASDGTPAREYAPGQVGRDDGVRTGPPEGVVTGRQDADRRPPAAEDAGRPDDTGEAPGAPPAADAVPMLPETVPRPPSRPHGPTTSGHAGRHQPADTAPGDTTPAEDAPGGSEDAPGRTGQTPPAAPGAAPGRSTRGADDHPSAGSSWLSVSTSANRSPCCSTRASTSSRS